jgi:hypothetical protein
MIDWISDKEFKILGIIFDGVIFKNTGDGRRNFSVTGCGKNIFTVNFKLVSVVRESNFVLRVKLFRDDVIFPWVNLFIPRVMEDELIKSLRQIGVEVHRE